MSKVYILGGLRSNIGLKNGVFKNILPEDLGAEVVRNLIKKYNIDKIDEVICGNTVGPGGNIARLMSLKAGIKDEVPSYTVDMQCGSSTLAFDIAFAKIKSGQCDLIIAGGIESTSTQPQKFYNRNDIRFNEENSGFSVAQFSPKEIGEDVMIKGAERVAKEQKITKEELDFWTLESHRRAVDAKRKKILEDTIITINNSTCDEGIRDRMNQKLIDRLKPLVCEDGIITPANVCLINDGAAFIVLCSEKYIKENRIKPKAEIIDTCIIGGNALYSPMTAMKATDKILQNQGLEYDEVSLFEFNEAFAVIDVLFQRKNPHLINRYNILGGALAYGHPYGVSGAIIMLHLMKGLEYLNGDFGITSIAAAGGIGSSILIKRINHELF